MSRSFFNEAAETESLDAFEPMLGNERMVEEVILGRNLATSCGIAACAVHKAQAHMICVEEIPRIWGLQKEVISEKDAADRKFAGVVAKAEAEAKHHRVKLMSHVVVGRPAPAIVAFIAWDGFDLLVTESRGIRRSITGSSAKPPTGWSNSSLAPC